MPSAPAPIALLLLAALVLAGCSGNEPDTPPDADGDGLFDGEETAGWGVNETWSDGAHAYATASDPGRVDSDGDGLDDHYEFLLGMDPRLADSDGDGLSDCQEAYHRLRAECEGPRGELETRHDGGYGTLGSHWDTDRDGLSDGDEALGFDVGLPSGASRHETTDPLAGDSDHDGLNDGDEVHTYRSDPLNLDTDGDGCRDGLDPIPWMGERYGLVIDNLTWNGAAQRLRFSVLVAGTAATPGGAGGAAVTTGPNALGLATGPLHPTGCTVSPKQPWVPFSIVAQDEAGASLDLTSGTNPAGTPQAFWDPVTGGYAWQMDGLEAAAPSWSGTAGRMGFHLLLEPHQAT